MQQGAERRRYDGSGQKLRFVGGLRTLEYKQNEKNAGRSAGTEPTGKRDL